MPRIVGWLVAALVLASPAHAEVFKCKAKNGLPLYQNFPCEIDSLGALPDPLPAARPASAPTSIQVPQAPPLPRTASAELRVGMTADEVKKLWGEPPEILQDEPRSGRVEIWQYADGRVVQVNSKHRVISVQR